MKRGGFVANTFLTTKSYFAAEDVLPRFNSILSVTQII